MSASGTSASMSSNDISRTRKRRTRGENDATSARTVEIKVERIIPAPPSDVFDAWLDPMVPGTLWHGHEKLIFNPKVDGLWYVLSLAHRSEGTPHYGRFTEINRPGRIQHSWMSRSTDKSIAELIENGSPSLLVRLCHVTF